MQKDRLEPLLKRAELLEKKYKWLQAAEIYSQAFESALEKDDFLKSADFQEKRGYCYYRASFQAQNNTKFQKLMNTAISSYEKQSEYLGIEKEENKTKINHANAKVAYMKFWLEEDLSKKKKLLDEWWILENKVIEQYEKSGNLHSFGTVCNDLLEVSRYLLFNKSTNSEQVMIKKEILNLTEKAIQTLQKSGDNYQLARAYFSVSAWYKTIYDLATNEQNEKSAQLLEKSQDYSKKAIELSLRTEDAWVIGLSYLSAWEVAFFKGDTKLYNDYHEKIKKYARISKDKRLLLTGANITAITMMISIEFWEDPDKQREICEKVRKIDQDIIRMSQIINSKIRISNAYENELWALIWLAIVEIDPRNKENILVKIIEMARKYVELFKEWQRVSAGFYGYLSAGLYELAKTKSEIEDKKALLIEADSYQEKLLAFFPKNSLGYYNLALRKIELANTNSDKKEKVKLLKQAVLSLNKSDESLAEYWNWKSKTVLQARIYGKHIDRRGRVLQEIYYLTKDGKSLSDAIEAHNKAALYFTNGELPAHAAESYWNIAQLQGEKGDHQEASQNYESASQAYDQAAKKIPQLKDFYEDYSSYMQAWSHIEQARYHHSIEEYDNSRQQYTKAAKLHELTNSWSYLAPNYLAWASMEEAESLSRSENTQKAKETFQKAQEHFTKAETSIKQKITEIISAEEKELVQRLLQASDLRRRFCQARILIEEARLLDRGGKYLQSSKSYQEAAQNITSIAEKVDVEAECKEMEYLAILCQAWEKMALAEETTSAESYLEAAKLFEQAKNYCYTKKASLWAIGNSSFCKGLAAGTRYQDSMDLKENALAKRHIKRAATSYHQAGYKNASEYAKATQRLFDAYVFMNQAESEVDPEKKTKQYQIAENLLQIAAGSFMKAKQPEKTAQVQEILVSIREEKALAVSLSQVMKAPSVALTTQSFSAPSTTSEVSVGLEQFQHANVQANLIAGIKEVRVGESFCLTVEFVNAGKEPALLTKVEDLVPPDFIVVKKPEIYRLEETCLNMKGRQLTPLKLVEAKLVLQPSKKGLYQLKPTIHYLDELGQNKSLQLKSVEIKVEEVVLADRVSTGTRELDSLLLGGIPIEYAVVLTGPPSDERETIIKNFLEAGIKQGQTSFHVTTETEGTENLLMKSGFYLFLCNPKPKVEVPDQPNIYKLHGKTDLTNLNIALLKAFRNVEQSTNKRVCIDIVSDVLVDYGVKATRKWIAELNTDLISKGFTVLALINPLMHTSEELYCILDLFDGEIALYQAEDPLECIKSVRVKKLRNKDYIKNPMCLI